MADLIFKFRDKEMHYFNNKIFLLLIFFTTLIAASQIFSPFAFHGDTSFFYLISKYGKLHGVKWYELYFDGMPWLDKPHLPFWINSIFFHFFNINFISYISSGVLFLLIGIIYVYKLALILYEDENISLLSALFFVSTLSIMNHFSNPREEIYLIGEIIPASYYWLKYNNNPKTVDLFLGAFFSALAIMTKGIYTLIPIFSGIITLCLYKKKYIDLFSLKWVKALGLSLFFIFPEILANYLQFGFYGVYWFFIDSQFGRFLNSGAITQEYKSLASILKRVISDFMPWILVYLYSLYYSFKEFLHFSNKEKNSTIFLLGSFFVTFFVFLISKFRSEHYFYILYPFAAIMCANFFYCNQRIIYLHKIQIFLAKLIFCLAIISSAWIFFARFHCRSIIFLCIVLVVLFFLENLDFFKSSLKTKSIFYSVLAVNILYLDQSLIVNLGYKDFSAGYQIQIILEKYPSLPVFIYNSNNYALISQIQENVTKINNLKQLPSKKAYYLLVNQENLSFIQNNLSNFQIIKTQIPELDKRAYIRSFFKSESSTRKKIQYWTILKISSESR